MDIYVSVNTLRLRGVKKEGACAKRPCSAAPRRAAHAAHAAQQAARTRSESVPCATRAGFLVKCGAKVKSWKKRFFVLVEVPAPTLYYFEKPDAIQEKGKIVSERRANNQTHTIRERVCQTTAQLQPFNFNANKKKSRENIRSSTDGRAAQLLDATTIVKPTFSLDKKHVMEIVTPDRTYQIYDDDSAIVDAWIAAINASLGKKLRSLSDPGFFSRHSSSATNAFRRTSRP